MTSEYKTLYLDQECCAAGAAAIRTGDKIRQCYYTDVAAGVAPAEKKLMYVPQVRVAIASVHAAWMAPATAVKPRCGLMCTAPTPTAPM